MSKKHLAFSFKNEAQKHHNIRIAHSHSHELIAAYFGFSSLASMDTAGIILSYRDFNENTVIETDFHDEYSDAPEPSFNSFIQRARDLCVQKENIPILLETLTHIIEETGTSFISYEELEHCHYPPLNHNSVKAVIEAIENGRTELLALLECESPDPSGSYWYKQKLAGKVLSNSAAEWADSYEEQLNQYNLFKSCLMRLSGNADMKTALLLVEHDEDNSETWCEIAAKLGSIEAQERMVEDYGDDTWLEPAALKGNRESLEILSREAADTHTNASAFEAHKWVYLAELYGFNLTQSLADNDEDYGPAFVIYEGVNLPKLAEEDKARAKELAQQLYNENRDRQLC
ncbi:hypothetical protein AHAT_23120 [Agarivorans sp. Toyoura001]|uniref:hypothetical protein n=1 Tax=Agarivorans sp. Toyoura001 TaxID=2283141 RepID=UPI0010D4FC36|nr:hypothetical protein [Agarivorans sp. Toyoura001]GDY26422.1 hypothetical protein AHAT_23120 [Agarivorans sp. Toyoura001]